MGLLKDKWDGLTEAIASWMHGGGDDGTFTGDLRNPGHAAEAAADRRAGYMPKLLAGLLLFTAIVMLTFVTAAALVKGFSGKHPTRLTHAMAEQQASSEYRKARVRCQQFSSPARDSCIAEAHAAEERVRAVAMLGQQRDYDYVSRLRSQTDAAIDAADRDSIVVEPACNIVARGQGSLCEIQVKPNALGGLSGTNLIPASMTAAQYAALHPLKTVRAQVYPDQAVERPAPPQAREIAREPLDRIFQFAWSSRQ